MSVGKGEEEDQHLSTGKSLLKEEHLQAPCLSERPLGQPQREDSSEELTAISASKLLCKEHMWNCENRSTL